MFVSGAEVVTEDSSSPSPPPPSQTMPEITPLKRVAMETVEVEVEPGAGDVDSIPPSPSTPPVTPSQTTHTSTSLTTTPTSVQPSSSGASQATATSLPSHLVPSSSGPTFASSYDLPPVGVGKSKKQARPSNLQQVKTTLYPLGRQVASGNKHLLEPSTPTDFKASPEWVFYDLLFFINFSFLFLGS